jgi:hypothetical protein
LSFEALLEPIEGQPRGDSASRYQT